MKPRFPDRAIPVMDVCSEMHMEIPIIWKPHSLLFLAEKRPNGHNYIGHTYTGHNYIGHAYIGHTYTMEPAEVIYA